MSFVNLCRYLIIRYPWSYFITPWSTERAYTMLDGGARWRVYTFVYKPSLSLIYDAHHFLQRLLGSLVGIGRSSQTFPPSEPYVPLSWHTAQTLTASNLLYTNYLLNHVCFHSLYCINLWPANGTTRLLSNNSTRLSISFLLDTISI